jgi:hypothetical protein
MSFEILNMEVRALYNWASPYISTVSVTYSAKKHKGKKAFVVPHSCSVLYAIVWILNVL